MRGMGLPLQERKTVGPNFPLSPWGGGDEETDEALARLGPQRPRLRGRGGVEPPMRAAGVQQQVQRAAGGDVGGGPHLTWKVVQC